MNNFIDDSHLFTTRCYYGAQCDKAINCNISNRCVIAYSMTFSYFSTCLDFLENIKQTVKLEASTVEIEERGVKLRLTVVDTPGFGDAIDNTDWYVL